MAYKTADLRRKYAEWSESVSDELDAIKADITRMNAKTHQAVAAYWSGVARRWEQMKPDFEKIRPFIDSLIEKTKTKLTGSCCCIDYVVVSSQTEQRGT